MNKKKIKVFLFIIAVLLIAVVVILIMVGIGKSDKRKEKTTYAPDVNADYVYSEKAGLPRFSAESGFYDEEFTLTVSAEEGEIYYTMDGTDPAFSSTALRYENPIRIYDNTDDSNILSAEEEIVLSDYSAPFYRVDKGIIIRAAVKDGEGCFGKTVTKSYFVGKTKDYYRDMKVISLVTNPYNLFDSDYGIYAVGNSYYRWKASASFDPDMEDWRKENPTNYNNDGKEWERPACIQVFENGELVYEQNLGIRLSGNVSRSNAQKSIRLYAREEYGDKKLKFEFFDGLEDINGNTIEKFDKITLRNEGNDTTGAFLRDELVQGLCADRAVGVQAEEPCILFIDGEFWGMYHLKERIEDYYFASHYDIDKKNVTYIKNSETEGSAEILKDYENFYIWAMAADLSLEENYQKVADTIDLQSFMDYFAIETYINNYDWLYVGRDPNNTLMWRANEIVEGNPYADGRWRFVLFDTEYSANLYGQPGTKPEYNAFENISKEKIMENPGALFFRLLNNDSFREDFYINYLEIMDNNFDPERVEAWINDYTAKAGDAISDNFKRFLNAENGRGYLDYNIEGVKRFYNNRPELARKYLDELCWD